MIVCMFIIVVVHLMFLFFFSSRRRHTRCALLTGVQSVLFRSPIPAKRASTPPTAGPADVRGTNTRQTCIHAPNLSPAASTRTRRPGEPPRVRTRVVSGKRVYVRIDLGGRRLITKKMIHHVPRVIASSTHTHYQHSPTNTF